QQITAPESPTGYMALPDRGADDAESTDPRFAEADRCHEVYGRRQMQFYVFFGWVRVAEDLLAVTPTIE
ncbi:MAG: hypothetical protein KKA73_25175, partial [Chloroflexi bacterium]|nr:hypothetical protein [Chloroflexota bacterium]